MPAITMTPYQDSLTYAGTFAGKAMKACLALSNGSLTDASTVAQWDAQKLSGNGYSDFIWTLPAGSFNATTGRFEAPSQLATFAASAGGAGLTWNALYLVAGTINGGTTTWETTAPRGILLLGSNFVLPAGKSYGYTINLFADGFTVTS